MLSQGYRGTIFPVNNKRDQIQGLAAYRSIADLPATPEAALVTVPANEAVAAVTELAECGVKSTIVFSSGFAESGAEGAHAQTRMVDAARSNGMRLLGPNCLGLYNATIGYFPTFTSSFETGWPLPGKIGIISQSGAYGAHLMTVFRNRGIGTSTFVTTGNEADVTVSDVLGWMVEAPDVDVITLYLEGVRDGSTFVAALDAARAARKPVVVLKVGNSVKGQAAARSHTASLAGDNAVMDAVLNEFATVRAQTTEEMIDIAYLATKKKYPASNTLGMLSISGGAGVIVSDAAEIAGLSMPELPRAAQEKLKSIIPFSSTANPVDCTAQVLNDISLVGTFCDTLVEAGGYSSVLAFFTMVGGTPSFAPALRKRLSDTAKKFPDRLYVLSMIAEPEYIKAYEKEGFAVFEDPSRAVRAISAMGQFGAAFGRAIPRVVLEAPSVLLPTEAMNEAEAKRFLQRLLIPSVPECLCASAEEAMLSAADLGYPVVLKIASAAIPHKSEIGGVLLNVADATSVRAGFDLLLDRARRFVPTAPIDGIIVAKQFHDAIECVMGIHQDPIFGPIAMFGLGGIYIETMRDIVFRRCPFDEDAALEMINSIKSAAILKGARGKKSADLPALGQMLSRLSAFADQVGPALKSIDLNPVFAMPLGMGAYVADALIEVEDNDIKGRKAVASVDVHATSAR